MEYLYEIQRVIRPPRVLFRQLSIQIGLSVCTLPFPGVLETALDEGWTRDPFDRVIVAQARTNGYAPLVSSDKEIRANYSQAVW